MKKRDACLSVISFIGVFMILLNLNGQEIEVKKEEGNSVVRNPLNPVKSLDSSISMTLKEAFVIGTNEEESNCYFENIADIKADDIGNIYVVDEQAHTVKMFDENGEHLRNIGRKGEGPGEFMYPSEMTFIEDKIVVYSGRRISYFTKEGDFIEFDNVVVFGRTVFDSQGNVITDFPGPPEKEFFRLFLRKLNKQGELIHQITESKRKRPSPDAKRDAFPTLILFAVRTDDSIVWTDRDKYELFVVDSNGKVFLKIQKVFKQVEFTTDFKQRFLDHRGGKEEQYIFPKYLPPIRFICTDDSNRIFVCTYEREGEDTYYYDIFDENGFYVERIAINGLPMYFKNEYLYCRGEDDNGLHQVIRYKIEIE